MACDTQTFHDISLTTMASIRIKMNELGMPMTDAHTGQLHNASFNVLADYHYHPDLQQLEVTVVDKPMFLPCFIIDQKIKEAIDGARSKA